MRIANVVLNDFTRDNRVLKIATLLQKAGADVTVVALHKIGLPKSEEHAAGFKVHRIPILSPKRSVFALLKWGELTLRIAWRYRRYDVWHCNDAEAFAIGVLAKWWRPELRLIYDCHEFEAERNGKPQWYLNAVRRLENRYIKKADEVIVVSPSIEAAYRDRYATKGLRNLTLIRNVPNVRTAHSESRPLRNALGLGSDDFVALYQGALTINRGVETLLAMAAKLEGTKIQLVFMGYGLLEPMVREAVSAHENVHFQPAVPYDQVLAYTADADVGLVSVKPTCLSYLYCLPNKLFESIQAGIPILVNDLPDCVSLVEGYGIGEKVGEDSPDGWMRALTAAAKKEPAWKEQARAGLEAAQKELRWEQESLRLLEVYQRVGLPSN